MARYAELMTEEAARVADDIDEVVPRLQELMPTLGDLALARALQVVKLPLNWPPPRARRIGQVRASQYEIVDRIIADRQGRAAGKGKEDLLSRLFAAEDPKTFESLSQAWE
ncbi:cytochrome P450 family protein [Micromonospora chalcea]|uniref:hypothetical protein n=1 Tax=Micromonospora chalcea TaxID=1874 RepID=UPI003813A02E